MSRISFAASGLIAGMVWPGYVSARTFTDYFKATPIVCTPTTNTWGDKAVLPRDTCNGLEDTTGTPTVKPQWMYWDGKILRAADGKYHMFADRWPHANGMGTWVSSDTIHAVGTALLGPYVDQGYAFNNGPDSNDPHKGHNVTASELPDGTYCLIVNEIVPFTIFTATSLDGPWTNRGHAQIDTNGVPINIPQPGDQHLESNVSFVVRPDGNYEIIQRHGIIAVSTAGLLGPYKVQQPTTTYVSGQTPPSNLATVYPNRPKHLSSAAPQTPESVYVYGEDPIIWYSGGQFHVIYDYPDDRVAYHLTSPDGIHGWTDQGLAFDPRDSAKLFTNSDGSVGHWYNVERPNVVMEDGHVSYFTFAVSDVYKMGISGSSNNDTKVVVVAFDGVTFDQETGIGGSDGGMGGTGGAGGRGGADGSAGGSGGRDGSATGSGGSSVGTGGAGGATTTLPGTGGAGTSGGTSGRIATGGRSGSGGATASGGASGTAPTGGRSGVGGEGGTAASGGAGGLQSAGGSNAGTGGQSASPSGTTPGSAGAGGASGGSGGSHGGAGGGAAGKSGCACALADSRAGARGLAEIVVVALCALAWVRRRRLRRDPGVGVNDDYTDGHSALQNHAGIENHTTPFPKWSRSTLFGNVPDPQPNRPNGDNSPMTHSQLVSRSGFLAGMGVLSLVACSTPRGGDGTKSDSGTGGHAIIRSGGSLSSGGATGTGGATGSGGKVGAGGSLGSGGTLKTGTGGTTTTTNGGGGPGTGGTGIGGGGSGGSTSAGGTSGRGGGSGGTTNAGGTGGGGTTSTGGTGGGSAACQPDCAGKTCGSDGCDGTCGGCPPSQLCGTDNTCKAQTTGVVVDVKSQLTPISPGVYGLTLASDDSGPALGSDDSIKLATLNRWGGDETESYNWKADIFNPARWWACANVSGTQMFDASASTPATPANLTNSADRFVNWNKTQNVDTLMTIPITGWVGNKITSQDSANSACASSGDVNCCASIGTSESVLVDKGSKNLDTSYMQDWVTHLTGLFGSAASGGIRYYQLDNEPDYWLDLRPDVMPALYPPGKSCQDFYTAIASGNEAGVSITDDFMNRTMAYATAIKKVDPSSQVLFLSAMKPKGLISLSSEMCGVSGPYSMDSSLASALLKKGAQYEASNHQRILDCLDSHYPNQESGTSGIWDTNNPFSHQQAWINSSYPGTGICVSEYTVANDGSDTATASQEADLLGSLGAMGVRVASYFRTLNNKDGSHKPVYNGWAMFRNYDGAGGKFGTISVGAASSYSSLHAYASTDSASAPTKLWIMLANVGSSAQSNLSVAVNNFTASSVKVFQSIGGAAPAAAGNAAVTNGAIGGLSVAANSVTLLVAQK